MLSKKRAHFLFAVLIMLFILSATAYGAVFNVTTPAEFQDALNTAASNNEDDTINAASGTYAITTTLTCNAAENYALTIIGAGAGFTILDGGGSVQILNISSSAPISISGITFRNGISGNGGGLHAGASEITVSDAEFSSNIAENGGGAYISANSLSGSATVILSNNTFNNNKLIAGAHSEVFGGGVYISAISSSGSSAIILTNNTFNSNNANSFFLALGGNAYVSASKVTLTNNVVSGGRTSAEWTYGGGVAISASEIILTNNTVSDNESFSWAEGSGGGIYISTPTSATSADIYNNIFYNNTHRYHNGDDLYIQVSNAIDFSVNLFNNNLGTNADFVTANSEDLVITNISNYSHGSNIQTDCLLTADSHLQTGSPCINAGTNSAPFLPTTDFEGEARIIYAIADIGADEYSGPLCTDNDNDGYAVEGGSCGAIDCDDGNSLVYPGAPDIICDGVDNNCNGVVDDDYISTPTTCGVGACAATGQLICSGGVLIDTCTPGTPTAEICDVIDNDCNGIVDDGIVSVPTTCGIGACASTGTLSCQSGVMVDSCQAGTPGTEGPYGNSTCSDAIDNDCDGNTDSADSNCQTADLIEISISNPPATAVVGSSFQVSDTVKNQGNIASGASTTRFYLSIDKRKDAADKRLSGRAVPALNPAATSRGRLNVTIPTTTPSGTYYLLACADDTNAVVESSETNNCRASATTVQITP